MALESATIDVFWALHLGVRYVCGDSREALNKELLKYWKYNPDEAMEWEIQKERTTVPIVCGVLTTARQGSLILRHVSWQCPAVLPENYVPALMRVGG